MKRKADDSPDFACGGIRTLLSAASTIHSADAAAASPFSMKFVPSAVRGGGVAVLIEAFNFLEKMLCVCCSNSSIEKHHDKRSKLVRDASSRDIYIFCRHVVCGSGQLLSHAFDMYDGIVRRLLKASRTDNPWFCDIEAIKKSLL